MMRKICFFCGGFAANGGIGRVVSVLSDDLQNNTGYSVFLCSLYEREADAYYPINPECGNTILFENPIGMTKAMLCEHAIKKLVNYIKTNGIELIVACGALYYPLVVIAAKLSRIKCICWEHISPEIKSDYKFQDRARSFGAKHSDLNVVLTKSALKIYEKRFSKSNNRQIYNPIDPKLLESRCTYNRGSTKIVSVGRLAPQKNFDRLLDIAKMVLPSNSQWTWDVYGEGPLRPHLEEKAKNLGIGDIVRFCGQVNDLYDRYEDYSFIVMTSDYEGFPMTLLEGAAKGLPMVSFDIQTGPNEIIRSGVNGYLCSSGNNSEMAEMIDKLINSPEMRVKMSHESRVTAEKFQLSDIRNKWVSVIESVLNE